VVQDVMKAVGRLKQEQVAVVLVLQVRFHLEELVVAVLEQPHLVRLVMVLQIQEVVAVLVSTQQEAEDKLRLVAQAVRELLLLDMYCDK
jgi:hypothetical protein